MRTTFVALALAAVAATAACKKNGTGPGVRNDISTQMQSAQPAFTQCYTTALQSNRKAKGMIVFSFRAAPKTGQFEQITIQRNEVNDNNLQQCVISEIAKLKLATPQKTAVQVPSYPLSFSPSN